jgi:hypothetical protein
VALLLLNKDPRRTFRTQTNLMAPFELIRYSQKQFAWRSAGENGKALRDLPPVRSNAPSNEPIALPPYSLTVVRGRL